MNDKHTQGEWFCVGLNIHVTGASGVAFCTTNDKSLDEAKANAEFICKAVNNYNKLVEENEHLKRLHSSKVVKTAKTSATKLLKEEHNKLVESNRELLAALESLSKVVAMTDAAFSPANVNARIVINNAKNIQL